MDKVGKSGSSLRPKARVLKALGEELISSETVAIIELVKNAYDADAKNVAICFERDDKDKVTCVEVIDDGHGMDLETIHNSWMVISTSNKKVNPYSKKGRRVLGEKGIGRFASAKIANKLYLYSKTKLQKSEEYFAEFDWSQFDNDDLYLDEISFNTGIKPSVEIVPSWKLSEFIEVQPPETMHGTILRMVDVKNDWRTNDFKALERGLSRLISPFKNDNGINIFLKTREEDSTSEVLVKTPEVIKYPHYVVKGSISVNGDFTFDVNIKSTDEKFNFSGTYHSVRISDTWEIIDGQFSESSSHDTDKRLVTCGGFDFEFFIWDRDQLDNINQALGVGIRDIRKDLDSIAGISIYRDGFRVLPYGEVDNDWLELNIRRVQKPKRNFSNNQIVGYINISADGNPLLHDQSNREGLDNNVAYSEFRDIVLKIINEAENVRASHKKASSEPKEVTTNSQRGLFDKPDMKEIEDAINSKNFDKVATLKMVSQAKSEWLSQISKLQDVVSQYHALATLGGIVDKILHDGRQPLAKIQTEAGLGSEQIQEISSSSVNPKVFAEISQLDTSFNKISKQANIIRDVFRRVEPFGGRKRGRPKKYYIEDVIRDVFSLYDKEIRKAKIETVLPDTQTLVSLDLSEANEIFNNLLTNSIYWLHAVPDESRKISVFVNRLDDSSLEIMFSDTGPGVPREYRSNIFDPYFSKRPDGHGLGLSLVGEIVHDYYNGKVELLDANGATFRIVLRKRV